MINNETSMINPNKGVYWVIMEWIGEVWCGQNHVLTMATSRAAAKADAHAQFAADGWRSIFVAEFEPLCAQFDQAQINCKTSRVDGMDWFFTIVEDRATGSQEGIVIESAARNPKKLRQAALRKIRSKFGLTSQADTGRFGVLMIFSAEQVASITEQLELVAQNRLNQLN